MTDRLKQICDDKRAHVAARKQVFSLADRDAAIAVKTAPRGFAKAMQDKVAAGGWALIAEIKRASPSKGLIREDFDPPMHASDYEAGGATCLSVLTDVPYFQGADHYLAEARNACSLPCLRKDFMVDPWQVGEARALGADAILIIVAACDDALMQDLVAEAKRFDMDVLVEVHNRAELERALMLDTPLIGINNRDLTRFKTDLATTEILAPLIPKERLVIAESGIASHDDCERLAQSNVHAFLVGETLMRQHDVAQATRDLLQGN
ncbi:indole-3-glycerol phosphate synthase TrpC [Alterisphingorhabdus coralli]|uniref:Indole-3-glycerol phosphate synthase n=1 Tax=Alterisphingorhabdus coralli TaxID=3071408 RepID=A0AA97F7I0_9SPHN|nr:indole-3-glycerol phosphate synthase TrpC [Parasphingorhabdus sp. SCSIO 66989]WOE73945.1 indole-3-glycerol phosphate synthase TrpC [Parasphingorhabdus sp. SCSIO 66989]